MPLFTLPLLFSVLLIVPLVSQAQPAQMRMMNKPVPCGDFGQIMATVTGKDWKEVPIWRGGPNEMGNQTVLFFNNEKTNWTLVEYRGGLGCVLGSGEVSALGDNIQYGTK